MSTDKKIPAIIEHTKTQFSDTPPGGLAMGASESRCAPDAWAILIKHARETWTGLTEADCEGLDASRDRLYGLIADRFGESRDAVKAKLDALEC